MLSPINGVKVQYSTSLSLDYRVTLTPLPNWTRINAYNNKYNITKMIVYAAYAADRTDLKLEE